MRKEEKEQLTKWWFRNRGDGKEPVPAKEN
jgi:hypothetical protein